MRSRAAFERGVTPPTNGGSAATAGPAATSASATTRDDGSESRHGVSVRHTAPPAESPRTLMHPAPTADTGSVNPRLRTLACAGSLAALALTAPAAVAGPTLATFRTNVIPPGEPRNITAGPDGALWFTYGKEGGKLGRATLDGTVNTVSEGIPGGASPWDVATGPDGNLWVTAAESGEILRVNPSTGAVARFSGSLTGASAPAGITAGPDGAMWFTHTGNGGGIGRITTAGTMTLFSAGLTPNWAPTDIAAGPDGNLWFTLKGGPAIGRITPAGLITQFTSGLVAGNAPEQITAGPDGNLWATLQGNPGYVARITPAGVVTAFGSGIPDNQAPTGITSAAGRLWFTLRDGDQVGSIDTSGTVRSLNGSSSGTLPNGIATGPDGNPWFVGKGSPARVGRVGTLPPDFGAVTVGTRTTSSVKLSFPLNANGQFTPWVLEYGRTSSLGSFAAGLATSTSSAPKTITVTLSGLRADTTYQYRLSASNGSGTDSVALSTFSTRASASGGGDDAPAPAPAPGETTDPPVAPIEKPVIGKSVVVDPVAGTVTIRLPGSDTDLPLGAAGGQLPVGTTIDARRGTVRLKTAVSGGTQTGDFWGGRFSVRQAKGAGLVTLTTDRTPLSGCGPTVYRPPAELSPVLQAFGGVAAKKPRRILWGKDNKGKFRTQGHDSVATVRGTRWATIETCAGTITKVVEGAVAVKDLRTKRTILVRAGHSYLARKKK